MGAFNSLSWEMLVQGLRSLVFNPGSTHSSLRPERVHQQQQEQEEKCHMEKQQESKRMMQRLLKQWWKEN
ncbi:Protein FAM156A/FAM156B [Sciurus carolinensis]|uniref:Protein FAM156A/FAM156B n=1 Tax=Sciurus carolinensis TaxID=30640 RepID=A0AA41MBI9_SCICA|nr:Protein FAM156A/FAM156B [Sciurus carolinensis]